MAERRMLALLGPCRVDGVGGGVGYEDLRGLDGVDVQALHEHVSSRALTTALEQVRDDLKRASRAANDAWWAPLGLHAPPPKFACCSWWPELVLPVVEVPIEGSGTISAAKGRESRAGAEKPSEETKPSSPDERWFDPRSADRALATMVASTARVSKTTPDDDAFDKMTNPAGAAARAVRLISECETDVAWITSGVDGGGGGGGEWPPEAVAAYGVLLEAIRAGGTAVIVVLMPDADDTHVPPLLAEIAERTGAEIRALANPGTSADCERKSSGCDGAFFDSPRWRGGLTVAAPSSSTTHGIVGDISGCLSRGFVTTTLPGFVLRGTADAGSRERRRPSAAKAKAETAKAETAEAETPKAETANVSYQSPRRFPRAFGDAVLLEIVRLETVPLDRRRAAPGLRLELLPAAKRALRDDGGNGEDDAASEDARAHLARRLRDAIFGALETASRTSRSNAESPAFLIRIPFGVLAASVANKRPGMSGGGVGGGGGGARLVPGKKVSSDSFARPPAPHACGPVLLVRPDGLGGFKVDALASIPFLLSRAVAVADAHALELSCAGRSRSAEGLLLGDGENAIRSDCAEDRSAGVTPASVASTGRKRRAPRASETTKAAAARRRSSERRRASAAAVAAATEASALNTENTENTHETRDAAAAAADDEDDVADDDGKAASLERALEFLASARVERALSDAVSIARRRARGDLKRMSLANIPKKDTRVAVEDDEKNEKKNTSLDSETPSPDFARVLEALVSAQSHADIPSAVRTETPAFLTSALLCAARAVARGEDVIRSAVRAARSAEAAGEPSAPPPLVGNQLALRPEPSHPSRSQSKSGASPSRDLFDPAGSRGAEPGEGAMGWAAAEAELKARVQRDRREKRERQRITMAPRHVPAARRTGNTILAAATGRTLADAGLGAADRSDADAAAQSIARGENKSGSGLDDREAPEPSESAVGADGAVAPRNRVCTKCLIELAPIPGVNMSLMKHCYACGGTLGAL